MERIFFKQGGNYMKNDYKRIIFIIATIAFVVTFFLFEFRMIIDSVDGYYNGSSRGLRFFGSQKKYYGLEGVTDSLEGWGAGMIIFYWPITLFQMIYMISFIRTKLKSIKKNKENLDKKEEQQQPTKQVLSKNSIYLMIYISMLLFLPGLNILSFIFSPDFPCLPYILSIFALVLFEALFIQFIKKMGDINLVLSIIIGILSILLFELTIFLNDIFLIPIFILFLSALFTVSLIFIDLWMKKYGNNHEDVCLS